MTVCGAKPETTGCAAARAGTRCGAAPASTSSCSKSKPNKKTNLDKIADFNVADDTIYLAKSAFSKIGKKGMLKKSAFHAGTDAHDANDRVIYNKKTGALFYDPDGNGDAAQVQIATLSKSLKAISNGDFFIT